MFYWSLKPVYSSRASIARFCTTVIEILLGPDAIWTLAKPSDVSAYHGALSVKSRKLIKKHTHTYIVYIVTHVVSIWID
jgi:hypothetical protein